MNFKDKQCLIQINWWKKHSNQPNWDDKSNKNNWGVQNKVPYPHIIKGDWDELLWKGIKEELPLYLGKKIQPHSGVRNLLSSWIACANLYFPVQFNQRFNEMMLAFLKKNISNDIDSLTNVALEFSLDGDLSPEKLLGEFGGSNGVGQTSPDVAFEVKTITGKGLILTECKYTEHSFYPCSARSKKERSGKDINPHPEICLIPRPDGNYLSICHQSAWGRKYLDKITFSESGKKLLNRCPASTAGYQLIRQQALANGIFRKGDYDLIVSAVSFDERNQTLIKCLCRTGIKDFQTGWAELFEQEAQFKVWHHQDWVNHARVNNHDGYFDNWLSYLNDRYGY